MPKTAAGADAGTAQKAPKNKAKLVAAGTVGTHLDISRQRVGQFVQEGVFQFVEGTKLDLDACRLAYIRWLRDENRRGSKSAGQSRAQEARAREIEMRIARDEGRLVEADDVLALVTEITGGFVAELRGVPAGSTRDPATRSAIEEVLNGAIDRCRGRFEQLGDDLRRGRGIVLDADEADA